jgi:hypothetical protein
VLQNDSVRIVLEDNSFQNEVKEEHLVYKSFDNCQMSLELMCIAVGVRTDFFVVFPIDKQNI